MDNGTESDELEEELAQEMMGGQFVDGAFFGKKAFELFCAKHGLSPKALEEFKKVADEMFPEE